MDEKTLDISEVERILGKKISSELVDKTTTHLVAVGLVANHWALFEMLLDAHALELAGIPENEGHCFTSQVIGPSRKLDAYIAIARLRGAKKANVELENFVKVTTALAERRNRVIHDPWILLLNEDPTRVEITARKTLRRELVPVSAAEMNKLLYDIVAHMEEFEKMHRRVTALAAASRDKSPPDQEHDRR